MRYLALYFLMGMSGCVWGSVADIAISRPSKGHHEVSFVYTPEHQESMASDSVAISSNHPQISVDKWNIDELPPTARRFKVILESAQDDLPEESALVVQYVTEDHEPREVTIPLSTKTAELALVAAPTHQENGATQSVSNPPLHRLINEKIHALLDGVSDLFRAIKKWVVSLLTEGNRSWSVEFLLVFILGLLMSFTPCIYPMIPITVGVLQTTGAHSLWRSFALAGSYTLGISTTFALLGLLASIGGMQFGSLMANPVVLLSIAAVLVYLGFSMFGWYELSIPQFLQSGRALKKRGSLLSAFVFGALSGTVASPCVSPGLALLLTRAAALKNNFLGFLLLFTFGVGSSLPLLFIGTFSSSINMLPRAGMWMIEVKKIFGFLLLGTALYYLHLINGMPFSMILILLIILLLGLGISYVVSAAGTPRGFNKTKLYRHVMGVLLLAAAIFVGMEQYKIACTCDESSASAEAWWSTDYEQARVQAQQSNKFLFLDFTAVWCSSCVAVDKKILSTQTVRDAVSAISIPVKVDCSDPHATHCVHLKKQFGVIGFPTYLLIDAQTEHIVARWGSEILELDATQFAAQLSKISR